MEHWIVSRKFSNKKEVKLSSKEPEPTLSEELVEL
jgi:hypothetical protein